MAVTSIVNRGMVNEGIADATALATARTVGVVESEMTLNVPSDFSTLQDAMDWIEARILVSSVTIQIADGTYNLGETRHWFEHPNYLLVSIMGNTTTPSNVTMNFTGSYAAFRINGCALRRIEGLKLSGGGYGVQIHQGGRLMYLNKVDITGMASGGVWLHDNAYVYSNYVTTNSNSATGYLVYANSFSYASNCTSNNNTGFGFHAEHGGYIRLVSYTATGNSAGQVQPAVNTVSTNGGRTSDW